MQQSEVIIFFFLDNAIVNAGMIAVCVLLREVVSAALAKILNAADDSPVHI